MFTIIKRRKRQSDVYNRIMIIAEQTNNPSPSFYVYASTIISHILKTFNVIKRSDAERSFINDGENVILRFDNNSNKLFTKLLPLNGKIKRFEKWKFLNLKYYDEFKKQPIGIYTIIGKPEKWTEEQNQQEERKEEENEEGKREEEEEEGEAEGEGGDFIKNINKWPDITRKCQILVDCGIYTSVEAIVEILRIIIALRYRETGNISEISSDISDSNLLSTTVIASNYQNCRQAFIYIKKFYTDPQKYYYKWSIYSTILNNIKTVNRNLIEHFNSSALGRILKLHDINVKSKYLNHVRQLIHTKKCEGAKTEITEILYNLISLLKSHEHLIPLYLQNDSTYEIFWEYIKGSAHLCVTLQKDDDKAQTAAETENTLIQNWMISFILGNNDEINRSQECFVFAVIKDYIKFPRNNNNSKGQGIRFTGIYPQFIGDAIIDGNKNKNINRSKEVVECWSRTTLSKKEKGQKRKQQQE